MQFKKLVKAEELPVGMVKLSIKTLKPFDIIKDLADELNSNAERKASMQSDYLLSEKDYSEFVDKIKVVQQYLKDLNIIIDSGKPFDPFADK